MTQMLTRTALVAAAASLLTACASTPQYPTAQGQVPGTGPQAPRPSYPVQSADVDSDVETLAEARPTTAVESAPLPPPAPSAASAAVETSALPPVAEREPDPQPETEPAPAAEPVMVPVTKTVILAPGKVIDVDGRPSTYTVREGQGLDAVARAMGSSRKELAEINKLKEPYLLKPGQVLKGPSTRQKAYVVASGDTLFAIARRFGVTAKALADENDIEVNASLRVGQKLKLPKGFKDGGPQKKTITVMEPLAGAVPPPAAPRPPAPRPVTPPAPKPQPVTPPPAATTPVAPPPAATPVTPPKPKPTPPATTTPPAVTTPPVKPAPTPTKPTPTPIRPAPVAPPVVRPVTPPPPAAITPARPPVATAPALPDGGAPALSDADIAELARGRFDWPVRGEVISDYGPKGGGRRNDGIDIGAPAGTPVRAAAAGKVVYSGGDVPGFGVTVLIQHDDGWVTVYGNLQGASVRMQQSVRAGEQIGTVGSSGGAPRPQLHFEVRYSPSPKYKAKAVDPQLVLPR